MNEKARFGYKGKSVADFGLELEKSDWIFLDDQLGVIKEKGNLLLSKKYFMDVHIPNSDIDIRLRQAFSYPSNTQELYSMNEL